MHEWALAEAVISTALKAAEKERVRKITEIAVSLGELQRIDKTIFESLLKNLMTMHQERFQDAAIRIETVKAVLKCRNCEHEWPFGQALVNLSEREAESIHVIPELAHACVTCPRCASVDFEITQGRGVWLESITGVQ